MRLAPLAIRLTACSVMGILTCTTTAQADISRQISNPISKLARIVSPKLVQVEDRVTWLDRQAASLAKYAQFPLTYGLGYRGCRVTQTGPDPTVTMDLGKEMPIDTIYLIPTQREYHNDLGIFPRIFTIEVDSSPDFSDPKLVYRSSRTALKQITGVPIKFRSGHVGRYIRLSVQQGHTKGAIDLFGLSEIFVISEGQPVSLQSTISTSGSLNISSIWYPEALIDGRTPLGIWHHGERVGKELGDAAMIDKAGEITRWTAQLPASAPIDRIVLFPYQIKGSQDISVYPQSLLIEIFEEGQSQPVMTKEWVNPLAGANHLTPLVFAMGGHSARRVTVTATQPWVMNHRKLNALSEVEVWSGGNNILKGIPIHRHQDGQDIPVTTLTDGFSSEKTITPIAIWLEQLTMRGKIEEELSALRAIYGQLASRSELNVSWGSAVVIGLTFLIPVFIVERRRMQSKEHLDIIRKRIASDLHDDIGSNLGSISLIARTARKDLARLNGPTEIDSDLGEVEMIARESSLAMRDIVWLLERKQDSIGDLVHRMRETASRLLREIDFTLECNSSKTAAKLTLDAKRHLFLFYKEAIHNVVKHSQANRVAIRLWDEGEQLGLEVLDNGVGLPVNRDRVSISVKKIEDRAEVIGGILQVTSSAETGTCIRLLVKRSHLTSQPKAS